MKGENQHHDDRYRRSHGEPAQAGLAAWTANVVFAGLGAALFLNVRA